MNGDLQQHRGGLRTIERDLVTGMQSQRRYSFWLAVARSRPGWPNRWLVGVSEHVTVTSTTIPRLSAGKPVQVPHSGTAWAGSRAIATRMRSWLPAIPLVGSNSIQPAPGTYTCTHA